MAGRAGQTVQQQAAQTVQGAPLPTAQPTAQAVPATQARQVTTLPLTEQAQRAATQRAATLPMADQTDQTAVDVSAGAGYNQNQESMPQNGGNFYGNRSRSEEVGRRYGSSISENGATGRILQDAGRQETEGRNRGSIETTPELLEQSPCRRVISTPPVVQAVVGHTVTPSPDSMAMSEVDLAASYGVPAFVVEDAVWDQIAPKGSNGDPAPAFSTEGQIYFRQSMPEMARGVYARHELTHVMRETGYQPYLDLLDKASTNRYRSQSVSRFASGSYGCPSPPPARKRELMN